LIAGQSIYEPEMPVVKLMNSPTNYNAPKKLDRYFLKFKK